MKTKYVRIVTFAALVAILILQGLWLYNTYKLLDTEFKKNISSLLIHSVLAEILSRGEEAPELKGNLNIKLDLKIDKFTPTVDNYKTNRAIQDAVYSYYKDEYPISLEKLDSIFKEDIKKDYGRINHSFLLTDSLKKQIAILNNEQNNSYSIFAYKETIQLRNIAPQYLTLTISSPYKVIFGKMALMLIASFILAVIVVYGLILQIRMISSQNTIAKMRHDFTHAMIHDMKNPITAITMGIGVLKSGKLDDKPENKEHYYGIITREGEHLLKLSNEILEIANFEKGQALLSKQTINLSGLLESVKEKYLTNTRKKIRFNIEVNEKENIYADLHYIGEVFDNLIDNAIKYSKDENVEIFISSSHDGNNTRINFKDNGIGISGKDQKIIFQKFERAGSVIKNPNKVSGFGLGLNFVYQVINAHGGTIKVNSRLGSYTEFIINLPYNENDKTIAD